MNNSEPRLSARENSPTHAAEKLAWFGAPQSLPNRIQAGGNQQRAPYAAPEEGAVRIGGDEIGRGKREQRTE